MAALLPALAWAEDKKLTPPDPLASGGRVLLFLLLILGLIVALAWLVHKSRLTAGMLNRSNSGLKIVTVQPLGLKEKIAVVQVGEQQLVVGITPQQITLLTELEQPLAVPEDAPVPFRELLKKAIRS